MTGITTGDNEILNGEIVRLTVRLRDNKTRGKNTKQNNAKTLKRMDATDNIKIMR